MVSIKKLMKIVEDNSIENLINLYEKEVQLSDKEVIQLTSFGTDEYVLEYIYSHLEDQVDVNSYEIVKQIWKEVIFNKNTKEILYLELTNNHSYWKGRKIML